MQVLSDLLCSAESELALTYPAQRVPSPSLSLQDAGDEEFPADLPVEYDRLLQLGSVRRGLRWAATALVAIAALLLSGFFLWSVHKFPKLTIVLGVVLAAVIIATASRITSSWLRRARPEPVWRDAPRPSST
jgi:hypothetical protein